MNSRFYIYVKHHGSSWDLTTVFCKYGLALAFTKVPKQPNCPLTFEPRFTGKQRWSNNLHLSWCLTPTLLLRKRVRMPHEFTSSGGRRENELKDSWSINTGCQSRPLKVCLSLFLLLPIFSHLLASLLSLPFFLLFFFFFAKGWPYMAAGPWLVGLQSAESIDRASRTLSTCSRSNKSITLLL